METIQILQPTAPSINSPLSDIELNILLKRDYTPVNQFSVSGIVNTQELYEREKNECTKYRLTTTINPICTNVLFNPVSIVLNPDGQRQSIGVTTRTLFESSHQDVSDNKILPGFNIFDNHLFRTDLFKKASRLDEIEPISPNCMRHAYVQDDISSFPVSIDKNLSEENGWVGFKNPSKIVTIDEANNEKFLQNKGVCEHIDMFPDRKMFSFNPIVEFGQNNSYLMEHNWDYCLTYPFENHYNHWLVSNGIPIMYVEFDGGDNMDSLFAFPYITVTTAYNNNFRLNDRIRIRNIDHIIIRVIDSVRFVIRNDRRLARDTFLRSTAKKVVNGIECDYYIRKFRKLPNWKFSEEEITPDNIESKISEFQSGFSNSLYSLPIANTIFSDNVSQSVFTDTIDVKFLKDNLGRPLSEIFLTILKNNDINSRHQRWWSNLTSGYELMAVEEDNLWFELNTTDRNRFMVDYPSISYLHNIPFNNGRVFTAVDSTLPYMIDANDTAHEPPSTTGEFWGNLPNSEIQGVQFNRRFPLPPNSLDGNITNDNSVFFGDIVEYNKMTTSETILEPIFYRFNTRLRESIEDEDTKFAFHEIYQDDYDRGLTNQGCTQLTGRYNPLNGANSSLTITRTCDDENPTPSGNNFIYRGGLLVGPRPEGYKYQPHNRIRLKNWSERLNQKSFGRLDINTPDNPQDMVELFVIDNNTPPLGVNQIKQLSFTTKSPHGMINEDLIRIHIDIIRFDKVFNIRIDNRDGNKFSITPSEDDINIILNNLSNIELRRFSREVPSYSTHIGYGRYVWRGMLKEGERENFNTEVLEHPFTNGHLYLDKTFRFYLQRQGENLFYSHYPNDILPENIDISDELYNPPTEDC